MQGIDSDNDAAFINDHLCRYCRARGITFTRSRPYKKDDNAHIEQKNWTHMRKLLGWDCCASQETCTAINDLYQQEWRLMMTLFQPSVQLVRRVRVGSRLKRIYDQPQTPLDRLSTLGQGDLAKVQTLQQLRTTLDPFALADTIERKLKRIQRLASRQSSLPALRHPERGTPRHFPSPGYPNRARWRTQPAQAQAFGNTLDGATIPISVTTIDGLTGTEPGGARCPGNDWRGAITRPSRHFR